MCNAARLPLIQKVIHIEADILAIQHDEFDQALIKINAGHLTYKELLECEVAAINSRALLGLRVTEAYGI